MREGPGPVAILIGTRPEAIKLFPVIASMRATGLTVHVAVSAQHRGMLDQVLKIAGITPDSDLDIMEPDQGLDALTARLIEQIGALLDRVRPARLIVQGDTTTAMCGSLAAYYRKIPVTHVEAGLRTGDILTPWPEVVNRRIITAIADQHFAPTQAADALHREGIDPTRVQVTGNTVVDALIAMRSKLAATGPLPIDRVIDAFGKRRIIAVTTHRRENWGDGVGAIASALNRLAERDDVAIILPAHPNPAVRKVLSAALTKRPNLILMPPLDYPGFVRLMERCNIVLTDSGGVQEEASTLGKPVLIMRSTTERPENIDAGASKLVGTECEAIIAAATELLDDPVAYAAIARPANVFGDGRAADRIAAAIVARLHRV